MYELTRQALGDEQVPLGVDARQHPPGRRHPQLALGVAAVHRLQVAQLDEHLAHGVEEPGDGAGAVLDALLEPVGGRQGLGPAAAHAGVLLTVGAAVAGVGAHGVAQLLQALRTLLENKPKKKRVYSENTAYYMTKMLEGAVNDGTGKAARLSGMAVAGKTGTTSNNRDAWFCGYTPYYTASVWIGNDRANSLSQGSKIAASLWRDIMDPVHSGLEGRQFDKTGPFANVDVGYSEGASSSPKPVEPPTEEQPPTDPNQPVTDPNQPTPPTDPNQPNPTPTPTPPTDQGGTTQPPVTPPTDQGGTAQPPAPPADSNQQGTPPPAA